MTKPLAGLKILDFTHVLAGPFATRILGDMGADVVKVNSAERAAGANDPAVPYYVMWNRNKRALALDMANPASRPLCRQLCDAADVVMDNFSVGVLDRWGVGYEEVKKTNPGVVYVQMSGMGEGGPWSKYVTFAPTIHALAGLTHLTGIPGRENIGIGFSYNDHQAGLHGTVAILAALESRQHSGKGQRVDLSQFEVGVNFAGPSLLDYYANGNSARPTGNQLPYDVAAPHGCYPCAGAKSTAVEDERWVAIACLEEAQWLSLKSVMGSPAWAEEATFRTAAERAANVEALDAALGAWTQTQDATAVMEQCQAAGVPAGVVQTGLDLAEHDPQMQHRDWLQPIAEVNPDFGQSYAERLPFRFSKTPVNEHRRVRNVGEDNEAVLRDWLGLDDATIAKHDADGVLK